MSSTVRNRTTRLGALAFGLVATLAGCGGGVNVLVLDAKAKTTDLQINNSSLQSDCEIVTGKALYNEQIMQIVVDLQSHLNDSQKLYWKCAWKDSDGFPLNETGWHFLPFKGNERKSITDSAPQPRAERCEFLIRRRSTDDHENQ